jgi:hypothetical protein
MRTRRAWLAAIVVSSVVALAACSSSASSPTTVAGGTNAPGSATASSTTEPSTPVQGANPGGDFCKLLKAEKTKVSQLSKTLGTALGSNNFASTKKTLTTYFDAVAQALSEVEASMGDAPADVQAALQTVNQYFAQLRSGVTSASSLTDLGTNLSSQMNSNELKKAGETLGAYTVSQCGNTSSSP